jgi:hypothetical protein
MTSEIFYAPDCPCPCDVCDQVDQLYIYVEDWDPSISREEFKQVAHSVKIDRLKELVDASRATCKAAKRLAKQAWYRFKSQFIARRTAPNAKNTILETYRQLPQRKETDDEADR